MFPQVPPCTTVTLLLVSEDVRDLQKKSLSAESQAFQLTTQNCSRGFRVGDDYSSCVRCPEGTYSDEEVSFDITCPSCPAGRFSNKEAAERCFLCAEGLSSVPGSSACLLCPAGRFAGYGWSTCIECPTDGVRCRDGRLEVLPGYWLDPTTTEFVEDTRPEEVREAVAAINGLLWGPATAEVAWAAGLLFEERDEFAFNQTGFGPADTMPVYSSSKFLPCLTEAACVIREDGAQSQCLDGHEGYAIMLSCL